MSDLEAITPQPSAQAQPQRLLELSLLFLKLGAISFGGPAAHIALIESEIVQKRKWTSRQQFLDMLGAANLIPGPTSTEVAINTGYVRAGWPGLCVAGASFIVPAAVITGIFAWIYVRFGTLPQAASVLAGVKPAVIAVIAIAIWRLGKAAIPDNGRAALAGLALGAFLLEINPIAVLFVGGIVGMLARRAIVLSEYRAGLFMPASIGRFLKWRPGFGVFALTMGTAGAALEPASLRLFLFFLKVGAVLFGGGYVLLAFLQHGLVQEHAWLTQQQLLDAVAIGQFTPGPVLSTATFIGYVVGGAPGAAVATIGIFLPSFLYVALLAPVLFRLRRSTWLGAFLDSVNACAVALMVGVTLQLGADALRAPVPLIIALIALGVLLKWKISPAWIVLGGGIAGLAADALRLS